jgi:hypothetical protein
MSTFTNYGIQVECLISWFPVLDSATLKTPRIRMSSFALHADDPVFVAGNHFVTMHGQALGGASDDGLIATNAVSGFTDFSVDAAQVFALRLELHIGRRVRQQVLAVPSNAITPFLLTLHAAAEDDPDIVGTAVALQGVVTAGRRRSELLAAFVRLFVRSGP